MFAESGGRVIQVSKDAILALKHVLILLPGRPVVWVVVGLVRPGQVAKLSNTELPVAHLLIRQAGNDHLRVGVVLSGDDVVVHG